LVTVGPFRSFQVQDHRLVSVELSTRKLTPPTGTANNPTELPSPTVALSR